MIAEWRTSSLRKLRKPLVGDVDPPRDPGVAPVGNMPEDPVEGAAYGGKYQTTFCLHHLSSGAIGYCKHGNDIK